MQHASVRLSEAAATALKDALQQAAAASGLPTQYPQDALAEAEQAVRGYVLPEADLTQVPFVTIDPEGSTDLDQALWIEDAGEGWRVQYAIADVPGFVEPGGAVDAETTRRGETAYLPQERIPLHPEVISEQAGSLLEGQLRGAYVWDFTLAADGTARLTSLTRAQVRSREQLSYPEAQRRLEAKDSLMLRLHAVGAARRAQEQARGGANLALPEQEIEARPEGGYRLVARVPLPIEEDNAQISLMTGMAAAEVMLAAKVGLLRTMPVPDESSLKRFRAVAKGLGFPWPREQDYGTYLRSLQVSDPRQLAIMHAAGSLFRGAGYTVFDGAVPEEPNQAAVAAPYAHTTAPLRRLVDRYALALCHAHVNGEAIPAWVRDALPGLPEAMKAATSAVGSAERRSLDIVEASVLSGREGSTFKAIVVDGRVPGTGSSQEGERGRPSVKVQLLDPPVAARAEGAADSGSVVDLVLNEADVAKGTVRLALVPDA